MNKIDLDIYRVYTLVKEYSVHQNHLRKLKIDV